MLQQLTPCAYDFDIDLNRCRADQLEVTASHNLTEQDQPDERQPDPAWLAARRRAMHVHVSLTYMPSKLFGLSLPMQQSE